MNIRYLIVLCGLLLTQVLQAQNLKQYEKAGDRAMAQGKYPEAQQYYKVVTDGQAKNAKAWFKYAQACRQSYALKEAEKGYRQVLELGKQAQFPELDLRLGQVLQQRGKYDEAADLLERYMQSQTKDTLLYEQATVLFKGCTSAHKFTLPVLKRELEKMEKWNTDFSDFGAHMVGNEVYITRLELVDANTEDASFSANLYNITKNLKLKTLNSKKYHTANSGISPDGKRLYFTRCEGEPGKIRCDIWLSEQAKDGTWNAPSRLPSPVNMKDKHSTQPYAYTDASTGLEVLLFSSNRPGGKGGTDIWSCTRQADGSYTKPAPLSEINTPFDEASPAFAGGYYYFSSDGHPGLGAFDVFRYKTGAKVENLGIPVNSPMNDVYYYPVENEGFAYFASNRVGARTYMDGACCLDIYKAIDPVAEPEIAKKDTMYVSWDPVQDTMFVSIPGIEYPLGKDTMYVSIPGIEYPRGKDTMYVSIPGIEYPPLITGVPTPTYPDIDIKALEKQLPIVVYFHNDEPDSNSVAITTSLRYSQTFEAYYPMKDLYKQRFAGSLEPAPMAIARRAVEQFFEEKVKLGATQLDGFCASLLAFLQANPKAQLQLSIRGFTSPRAGTNYNLALAQRRTSSLKNEFAAWQNGALSSYLQAKQLQIVELPIGEAQVPPGVSDNISDRRNSIYHPSAAAERRATVEAIILR